MKLSDALAPIDDVGEKVIDTTEEYVAKADDVVLGRVMRIMDHVSRTYYLTPAGNSVCYLFYSLLTVTLSFSLHCSHQTKQAPAFVTLKTLADAGGISATLSSIVSHPETFQASGLDLALDVPTMSFEVWTLICVFQALSLAKSALASNGNELSQSDITALVSCVLYLLYVAVVLCEHYSPCQSLSYLTNHHLLFY